MKQRSRLVFFGAILLSVAACSGETEGQTSDGVGAGSPGQGGGAEAPASNCASRCATLVSECVSESAEQTKKLCDSMCERMTEARLRCIEGASCTRRAEELRDGSVCGGASSGSSPRRGGKNADDDDGRDDDGKNKSSGTNGGNKGDGRSGGSGACRIGDAFKCDGDKRVTCVSVSGQPVQKSETCSGSCRAGECKPAHEVCVPYSVSSSGKCEKPCAFMVTESGRSYCTTFCGPADACPRGTQCSGTVTRFCKR